jgi:hypothetical protein
VPHWNIGSSAIESYERPTEALQRHAELAWYLREAGWTRLSELPDHYQIAAA